MCRKLLKYFQKNNNNEKVKEFLKADVNKYR
jgi:hypothetical protein